MTASLSRPYYAFAEEDQAAACLYLFQDELPNLSSKSNKLDGSFFFYPRMNVSSFSLLVLLLSYVIFSKNSFFIAFYQRFRPLLCLRFRSFSKADAKV